MTCSRSPWLAYLAALVLVLATTGCGPTKEQVATTTLVALPIAMSIAMLGVFVLRRTWGDEVSFPPWGVATIIVTMIAGASLTQSRHFDPELAAPVISFTSGSLLGLSLLVARIRLSAPAERSIVLSPLLVACTLALPFALVLLEVVGTELTEPCMIAGLMTIIGGFYLSPLVVLGLVIERVVAARRATRLRLDSAGSPSDPSDHGR